jgi:hypothetical protein
MAEVPAGVASAAMVSLNCGIAQKQRGAFSEAKTKAASRCHASEFPQANGCLR